MRPAMMDLGALLVIVVSLGIMVHPMESSPYSASTRSPQKATSASASTERLSGRLGSELSAS